MLAISRSMPYLKTALQESNKLTPLFFIQQRFSSDLKSSIHASTPLELDKNRMSHIGFKVIPQGKIGIVETWGKFDRVLDPGLHFLVPVMHCIRYSFPIKRVSFEVIPQEAFTKDNVSVILGGDIIVRVINPKDAAYGADAPFSLTAIYAQAAMRNAVGQLTLDDLLNKRDEINPLVITAVNKQAHLYGVECLSYEIKGLKVPKHIQEEMERQMTSERKRRETVKNSEGEKEANINRAEGLKRAAELSSEGEKTAKINEALGNAEKRKIEADAEALALQRIGEALRQNPEAATLRLASEALKVWQGMLGHSNTMVIPANTNPLETLLPNALAAYTRALTEAKETLKKKE